MGEYSWEVLPGPGGSEKPALRKRPVRESRTLPLKMGGLSDLGREEVLRMSLAKKHDRRVQTARQ